MLRKRHILNSIANAERHESKLDNRFNVLNGLSSKKVRHLLNNIVNFPHAIYLEIGVLTGSTFIAALYKNNITKAYCIDNWSDFQERGGKKDFLRNLRSFKISNYELKEGDCFKLDLAWIKDAVNVYFYDGDHSEESQYKALEYYLPVLADKFIFIVDDYDWEHIRNGTQKAINSLNLQVKYEIHLQSTGIRKDSWWHGLYIALLTKT